VVDRCLDQVLYIWQLGKVSGHRQHLGIGGSANLLGRRFQVFGVPAANNHVGAFLRQGERAGFPQALASTANHRHSSSDSQVHASLLAVHVASRLPHAINADGWWQPAGASGVFSLCPNKLAVVTYPRSKAPFK